MSINPVSVIGGHNPVTVEGLDLTPLSTGYSGAIKVCPNGSLPPYDIDDEAAGGPHGTVGVSVKPWFYPVTAQRGGTIDVVNVGLAASNSTTSADTVKVAFYNATTGAFISDTAITFTVGAASQWASKTHSELERFELPAKYWVGVMPELSTNTSATATVEYACSATGGSPVGFDRQFAATGNPNAADQRPAGYQANGVYTRPFSWPATLPTLINGSSIFGAYSFIALRIGILAE